VDVSTPPSQTLTLRPIATTLLGNASISMGRWKPPTRHKTQLWAVEPLQQGKTPGRLGNAVKLTPLHKKTEPCKLRSCESSRQNLTKIMSASCCSSKSLSRTYHNPLAEVPAEGLERCIDKSSGTGSQCHLSAASLE